MFNVRLWAGLLIFTTGCAFGSGSVIASTTFVYPNSNVVPLGPAKGSSSGLCGILFVNWRGPDEDDMREAIDNALAASGGDGLVDVKVGNHQFLVPGLFSTCSVSVEGTAIKQVVGQQELR
jgi:hypothetical protein